ncbi:nucleotide kinase domain-containing protein, partial [Streptomyces beigongshangae]
MVTLLQDRQVPARPGSAPGTVRVGDRELQPTPVFDTYWRFASARQAVYEARLARRAQPWTDD